MPHWINKGFLAPALTDVVNVPIPHPYTAHYGNVQNWPTGFQFQALRQYTEYRVGNLDVTQPSVAQSGTVPAQAPFPDTPLKYPAAFAHPQPY